RTRPGVSVHERSLSARHLVRLERANALASIVIRDLASGEEHVIKFDEAAYSLDIFDGFEFDTTTLRIAYSSMTTPTEIYDYDMASRERILRKRQVVPSGHDPAHYVTSRITAKSHDGALVPVSLLHRRGLVLDGRAPLLLYGTAPIARRCGLRSRPTACRWSIAVSSMPSPTSAAARTRAGAGISTASTRRRPTRSTISPPRAAR